ncbi:MAG: arginine--tRNA ligase [Candidatus Woesearchaeota archaeon]
MGEIIKKISKILELTLKIEISESLIEKPKPELGDYAFPCFSLAKELKKNPIEIAKDLSFKINNLNDPLFEKVESIGPYVNFFISKKYIAETVLKEILLKKEKYGSQNNNEIVLIESPGPNTNKPLHLGHVRNILLGNSIVNIYKFLGYKTYRVDIINDRGIHICKSMLAYKIYGNNQMPDKKPDHFVGDFYVRYAIESEKHPEYEQMIQEMLVKWENNDEETMKLWRKMTDWALQGFKETYQRYGVVMDKAYYESEHYKKGKEIVLDGLKKGIFFKDEKGNIVVDLTKQGLGKKVLLRNDGTSIYITQDIALGKIRYDDFKMDRMIYVVGNEQIHHFKALFEIFKLLNYSFADKCYHLAYGMISLPEGKMKSRTGKVVDADDLANNMHDLAKKELEKRYPALVKDNPRELDNRAEKIAMSAIKYFILKYDPMKDFVFNPNESLSFEGETGPYLQYTYARASSVIKKSNKNISEKSFSDKELEKIDYNLLNTNEDRILINKLKDFPELIIKSAKEYSPAILAKYLFELSQIFNEYYHKNKIIQNTNIQNTSNNNSLELEKARLLLVEATKIVLKNGLNLLGIETLEEM